VIKTEIADRTLRRPGSKRARFQHAYGEGVLSLEALKARLAEIEEREDTARRELRNLKGRQERIADLERDRDTLLEDYVGRTLEALDSLASEQRHQVYKMLRLKVVANEDGSAALEADALPALTYSNRETLWSPSTRIP
jgi:predicted  nucleic acid-binding Zn-ribbon protein